MGIVVLDIQLAEIGGLQSLQDFLMLLQCKYEELRFEC